MHFREQTSNKTEVRDWLKGFYFPNRIAWIDIIYRVLNWLFKVKMKLYFIVDFVNNRSLKFRFHWVDGLELLVRIYADFMQEFTQCHGIADRSNWIFFLICCWLNMDKKSLMRWDCLVTCTFSLCTCSVSFLPPEGTSVTFYYDLKLLFILRLQGSKCPNYSWVNSVNHFYCATNSLLHNEGYTCAILKHPTTLIYPKTHKCFKHVWNYSSPSKNIKWLNQMTVTDYQDF